MLPLSAPLWEWGVRVIAFVQFPWRLLGVAALALSFLSGAAVLSVSRLRAGTADYDPASVRVSGDSFLAALLFSLLLAFVMFPNAHPQYTDAPFNYNTLMDFEVNDHELLGDTIWMTGERPQSSPLVEQYRAGQITQKAVAVDGNASVELLAHHSQWDEVRVTAAQPTRILFYTRYFPGWTVTIDADRAEPQPYGEQGLLSVEVPPGTHIVRAQFGDTWPRQVGAAISLASLVVAVVWLGRTWGKTKFSFAKRKNVLEC
jgi:hypothetical protein